MDNEDTVKETYTGTCMRRVLASPVWNGLCSRRACPAMTVSEDIRIPTLWGVHIFPADASSMSHAQARHHSCHIGVLHRALRCGRGGALMRGGPIILKAYIVTGAWSLSFVWAGVRTGGARRASPTASLAAWGRCRDCRAPVVHCGGGCG